MRRDIFLIILVGLLFHLPGLGHLEFYRHTEADRTIIAWEMLKTGDFLVPHLLGSEILTKPPLYYWLVAGFLSLTGTVTEFTARLPSAFAAILEAVFFFILLIRAGFNRKDSLLGAAMLSTTFQLITLSSVAEIDMFFGLLSFLSLGLLYFALTEQSYQMLTASYLLLAIAFLAKGPPILFFFGMTTVFFTLYLFAQERPRALLRFSLIAHSGGILVASLIIGSWIFFLSERVGLDELKRQFSTEVVARVFEPSPQKRGVFFYFINILGGLAPWSIFLVYFVYKAYKTTNEVFSSSDSIKKLIIYSMIVVFGALFLLSLAEGKSSRYLFPVYPFAIILALSGLQQLRERWNRIDYLSYCLIFLMLIVRVGERTVYAVDRNQSRRVSQIASEISKMVPENEPIYTVEVFERWYVFYLLKLGRTVQRITPATSIAPLTMNDRSYLLLNFDEESWRYLQLKQYDPSVKVLLDLKQPREHLFLLECSREALEHLHPQEFIPTYPSPPFYYEYQ
jgi:4-amino-4-deoxy-L-arabinose transferase-like glycosyltransferase